jgi:hypothetical protein
MDFYLLSEGTHYKMDMGRANFYWESTIETHKYHMVCWLDMCRPTEFVGLGFVESRARIVSLLAKWIMKLERGDCDLSCQILRRKYCPLAYRVGDGKKTLFWLDVWHGQVPTKNHFPAIFCLM